MIYCDVNVIVNWYVVVLVVCGVGFGDVVGIMLCNLFSIVLVMLVMVKCGVIVGMFNYY